MAFNHDDLDYVVQVQRPAGWFANMAAFDCKSVARQYALDCQKANPQFVYRVLTKNN